MNISEWVQSYGHMTVVVSTVFYGLRIAGPIVIGMSSVFWPGFLLLNGLAAVLWALFCGRCFAGAGYSARLRPGISAQGH